MGDLTGPPAAGRGITGGIRSIRAGHSPNCSSAGSVITVALMSTVAAGVVVNLWADRLLRWMRADPPPESDPGGPGGGGAPPTTDPSGGDGPNPTGAPADPDPSAAPARASNRRTAPGSPRLRPEAEGAVLAWPEPPALLLVDDALADQLRARGVPEVGGGAAVPGGLSAPTEAHLAVTDRCPAACTGCYLSAGPDRPATEPGDLRERLDELAAMGVFEVAFGGGEALLREDLFDLAAHAQQLGMVANLTTSGFGLTPRRARQMAALFGQVNVSLDGLGETYAASRGWSGAARGLGALQMLTDAGVRCGVNTVLTRPLLGDTGALDALGDAAAAAGAVEWQWLRYKPAGRGAAAWATLAPSPAQLDGVFPESLRQEARTGMVIRFDCALVPFVADAVGDAARLEQLGVVGCPGGVGLWARSADGGWAPCSFAPGQTTSAPLPERWRTDPTLQAWRARAEAPPAPCDQCAVARVCRGGCRVVAAHLVGDAMAPDPQCPRVRRVG